MCLTKYCCSIHYFRSELCLDPGQFSICNMLGMLFVSLLTFVIGFVLWICFWYCPSKNWMQPHAKKMSSLDKLHWWYLILHYCRCLFLCVSVPVLCGTQCRFLSHPPILLVKQSKLTVAVVKDFYVLFLSHEKMTIKCNWRNNVNFKTSYHWNANFVQPCISKQTDLHMMTANSRWLLHGQHAHEMCTDGITLVHDCHITNSVVSLEGDH